MHAMIAAQQLKAEATALGVVALLDAQALTVTPSDLFNATSGDVRCRTFGDCCLTCDV
jgi:hypothetical protein